MISRFGQANLKLGHLAHRHRITYDLGIIVIQCHQRNSTSCRDFLVNGSASTHDSKWGEQRKVIHALCIAPCVTAIAIQQCLNNRLFFFAEQLTGVGEAGDSSAHQSSSIIPALAGCFAFGRGVQIHQAQQVTKFMGNCMTPILRQVNKHPDWSARCRRLRNLRQPIHQYPCVSTSFLMQLSNG